MLDKDYITVLKEHFHFNQFRDKQLEIIKSVIIDKKDICAIMFTGAGKSLCYQFPPVYTNKVSIVVSPLIALMDDQKIKLDKLGVPSICLNGTVRAKDKIKSDILANKYRIVYTTPEYIVTQKDFLIELLDNDIIMMIAIDESHCVSTWGHDFRDSYRQLYGLKTWLPNIPILAMTATATIKVQDDIIKTLKLNDPIIVKTTFDRPNLYIEIKLKTNPINDLVKLLNDKDPAIIYCQTRKDTEQISNILEKKGIICAAYHAGMTCVERESVHMDFVSNLIDCIVATVAFGMGIDKVIRKVIHYGIPKDIESYYQEIGRAGRDGLHSICYMFYSPSDFSNGGYFINKITNQAYMLHRTKLLDIMKKYIYINGCRRQYILTYFDEEYDKDNCNMCDNCVRNVVINKVDFTQEAVLLLYVIYETGSYYGIKMMIDVLRGSGSKKIPYDFKKLCVYGMGTTHSDIWWKIFSRMLININYLKEKPISGGHSFSICRTITARKWLEQVVEKDGITLKNSCKDGANRLILTLPKEMEQFYKPVVVKPKNTNIIINTDVNKIKATNTILYKSLMQF